MFDKFLNQSDGIFSNRVVQLFAVVPRRKVYQRFQKCIVLGVIGIVAKTEVHVPVSLCIFVR